LSASRSAPGAVAEILSKERVVSLHSGCGRCVASTHRPVDYVKAWLPFVQPQLEVSAAAPGEILGTPFNVEYAVGSSATYRCEYPEPAVDQIEVVPVREDREVVGGPWQALVAKGRIGSHKLRIAVGRQIDRGEGLVVQRVREGQRDGGHSIIAVIADVSRAWHDAAAYLIYHVHTDARRGR
jgi:hypothetical protein